MPAIQEICVLSNQVYRSLETVTLLLEKCESRGFTVTDSLTDTTDLMISIGGDGSFLGVMNRFNYPSVPVLAINTGHLGFFSEINPDEIDLLLDSLESDNYYIEEMTPLKADISTDKGVFSVWAINEIVIRSSMVKAIHLKIQVNEQLIQSFSGDGIIVSTSAGSTAYCYSAGGSIVDPRINVLQLTPLAPINTNSYRCFTSSVIFPPDACIQITPQQETEGLVVASADGINVPHTYFYGIEICLAERRIKMLRLKHHDFWSKVVKKFL